MTRLDKEHNAHDEERDPDCKQANRQRLDPERAAYGHGDLLRPSA
jgi:hypothetical protein